jgi:hypothetical protein
VKFSLYGSCNLATMSQSTQLLAFQSFSFLFLVPLSRSLSLDPARTITSTSRIGVPLVAAAAVGNSLRQSCMLAPILIINIEA